MPKRYEKDFFVHEIWYGKYMIQTWNAHSKKYSVLLV